MAWLPDGKTLAAYFRSSVWHLDPEAGMVRRKTPVPSSPLIDRDFFPSPGARFLAKITTQGFTLTQLGSEPARQRLFRLSPARESSGDDSGSAAFSPDGRYLACGNAEGVISLLRLSEQGKVPDLQARAPTARELAKRGNGADGLKHEEVPAVARAYIGGADARKAPSELVAVLGDTSFRCPNGAGRPAYSPDGKLLAVPGGNQVQLFDAASGRSSLGELSNKRDRVGGPVGTQRPCVSFVTPAAERVAHRPAGVGDGRAAMTRCTVEGKWGSTYPARRPTPWARRRRCGPDAQGDSTTAGFGAVGGAGTRAR
jgi:hypothetical protein